VDNFFVLEILCLNYFRIEFNFGYSLDWKVFFDFGVRDLQKESSRRTIAWQQSCSDFHDREYRHDNVSERSQTLSCRFSATTRWWNYTDVSFFFLMQRFPWYWYARSNVGPTKVRRMHPGRDLKPKLMSLHRNRRTQSNEYIYIKYRISLLFSSPPFFLFLFFCYFDSL